MTKTREEFLKWMNEPRLEIKDTPNLNQIYDFLCGDEKAVDYSRVDAIVDWLIKEIRPQRLPGRVAILLSEKMGALLDSPKGSEGSDG